ncbi:MAG: peptide synthase, partial [Desulfatitalea sp.]|nr:peptide synthase [Desulfatitalea sp.]NNK01914.1 peptide synthase [Desulfatitalea sp.]
ALVGVGHPPRQRPVVCIELERKYHRVDKKVLTWELLDLAGGHMLTKSIQTILYHPAFPVDIRHNSKIFREKLALWAEKELQ